MRPPAGRSLGAVLIVVAAACSGDPVADTTTAPALQTTLPTVSDTTLLPPTTTTTTTTETAGDELGFRWEVGDCLSFATTGDYPHEPFGSGPLAGCDDPHTHQVYHTGTFPGDEGAAYPEAINTEIREICIRAFAEYLGALPVETHLDILMYLPDADEWADGLRYQACLAYLPTGPDTFGEVTGSIEGSGSDFLLKVSAGDCLAVPYIKLPAVDCAQSHRAEVIASVSHPGESGAPYPGEEHLEAFAITECGALLTGYLVGPQPANPVVAFARPFTLPEWEAGWRELHCLAFVIGSDGGVVPVRGSFAEEGWTVVTGDQRA